MNLIKLSAKLLFGITVLLIVFPLATFVGCSGWPSSQDVREAFLKGRTTGKFLFIDNLDPNSIVVKKVLRKMYGILRMLRKLRGVRRINITSK